MIPLVFWAGHAAGDEGGHDHDDRRLEAELKNLKAFLELNRPRYGAQSNGPVDFIGKNREEV